MKWRKRIPKSIAAVAVSLIVTATLPSCLKKESFPIIPEIAYENVTLLFPDSSKTATTAELTISFKDGDGDIGLYDYETTPPYDKNFVIDYYEKQNGVFVHLILDTVPITFNYRIPYLTPNTVDKAIKGLIKVDSIPINPLSKFDTIMFKFFIYDRALHKSNTDSTPPILTRRF